MGALPKNLNLIIDVPAKKRPFISMEYFLFFQFNG